MARARRRADHQPTATATMMATDRDAVVAALDELEVRFLLDPDTTFDGDEADDRAE